MERIVILALALIALNGGVLWLVRLVMSGVDLRSALHEKAVQAAPGAADDATEPATSSSRLIGFVTSVVMCGFLWACGNILVYLAFSDLDKIPVFLNSISAYFVSGATGYIPYGINQGRAAIGGKT